ncbi:hypothetical protein BVX99_02770 [bacterium F16]|nr:hypothetical protein BVX99_02770 [bacterium F16]
MHHEKNSVTLLYCNRVLCFRKNTMFTMQQVRFLDIVNIEGRSKLLVVSEKPATDGGFLAENGGDMQVWIKEIDFTKKGLPESLSDGGYNHIADFSQYSPSKDPIALVGCQNGDNYAFVYQSLRAATGWRLTFVEVSLRGNQSKSGALPGKKVNLEFPTSGVKPRELRLNDPNVRITTMRGKPVPQRIFIDNHGRFTLVLVDTFSDPNRPDLTFVTTLSKDGWSLCSPYPEDLVEDEIESKQESAKPKK